MGYVWDPHLPHVSLNIKYCGNVFLSYIRRKFALLTKITCKKKSLSFNFTPQKKYYY